MTNGWTDGCRRDGNSSPVQSAQSRELKKENETKNRTKQNTNRMILATTDLTTIKTEDLNFIDMFC